MARVREVSARPHSALRALRPAPPVSRGRQVLQWRRTAAIADSFALSCGANHMLSCPRCAGANAEDGTFCQYCGASLGAGPHPSSTTIISLSVLRYAQPGGHQLLPQLWHAPGRPRRARRCPRRRHVPVAHPPAQRHRQRRGQWPGPAGGGPAGRDRRQHLRGAGRAVRHRAQRGRPAVRRSPHGRPPRPHRPCATGSTASPHSRPATASTCASASRWSCWTATSS